MRKSILLVILFIFITSIYAQTTKVNFISTNPIPIFIIKKAFVEDSKTFGSNVNVSSTSMDILGVASFSMEFENGGYMLNAGGYEEYNKTFLLNANGIEKDVKILGNSQKAKDYNLWALGIGFLFPLSFSTITFIQSLLPTGSEYIGYSLYALPVIIGSGFIYTFIECLIQQPRIVISDHKEVVQ
jgi:hypothetical protein